MNTNELRKLPISHLSLIILNEKNEYLLRKCAETELKTRLKFLNCDYKELLDFDSKNIKIRGLDINNYLFCPNPTMQQLMELYFTCSYNSRYFENHLLFSEKHLCNNMNFLSNFFDKICDAEIQNLKNRIKTAKSRENHNTLVLFKRALEKRKYSMKEDKEENYSTITKILEYNECFQTIVDEMCPNSDRNMTIERCYKILHSNLYLIWDNILDVINEMIFSSNDLIPNICVLNKVLIDSAKLKTQKKILLNQAKEGFEVDYSSPVMQKALKNVSTIDF